MNPRYLHFPCVEDFDMVLAIRSFMEEAEVEYETIGESVLIAFFGIDDVTFNDTDADFPDVLEFLFTGMRIIDMFGDLFSEENLGVFLEEPSFALFVVFIVFFGFDDLFHFLLDNAFLRFPVINHGEIPENMLDVQGTIDTHTLRSGGKMEVLFLDDGTGGNVFGNGS